MSPKELLYIEDALSHEREMQTVCSDLSKQLQDSDLKTFVEGLASRHSSCYTQFFSLLNK